MSFSASFDDDGGFEALVLRFSAASRKIRNRMLDVMAEQNAEVEAVAKQRLAELFPNPAAMQAAISSEVTVSKGNTVSGHISALGLPYLAIHEFGGVTQPHEIFPVNASVLAFMSQGIGVGKVTFRTGAGNRPIFATHVNHPGSVMPERSYLRYALVQRRDAIREAFQQAAADALAPGDT